MKTKFYTADFNGNPTRVTIPDRDEDIQWYTEKSRMRMSGRTPSTLAWWIDGIGDWMSDTGKKEIWNNVKDIADWDARDRQREHNDMPEWI